MLDSVVRREVQESIGQINHTLKVGPKELASIHRPMIHSSLRLKRFRMGL